jgi:large subunit ribosomal protein L19
MNIIEKFEQTQKVERPRFGIGDKVRVLVRITEGDKTRLQPFEGIVTRRCGKGIGETFTVRKISYGVGVERVFPFHSPVVEEVKLLTAGKVRQARLYYLRALRGKAARIREKKVAR